MSASAIDTSDGSRLSRNGGEPAPIALLCAGETPFADYLGEILYTEGLPWFDRVGSWGAVASRVGKSGVLLLPAGSGAEPATVRAWLDGGGAVVAMRPSAEVLGLAGVSRAGTTATELPLTLEPPFDSGTARAHGEVDLYELPPGSEAETHAHVRCEGERHPAVVSGRCGRGRLVCFAYDLPRSIALTRQGNPEWAGCRGTDFGSNTFRPIDLFIRGCGAETWLDFPSARAPLADTQQRLLAHLLTSLSPTPIPRLWYLPDARRTVLTIVGDSDGADPEVVSAELDEVTAAGGCMTTFLIDHTVDRTDAETVARWRAAGHEVSVHPDYHLHGDASKPDRKTMLKTQGELLDRFHARFGLLPRTIRNHSIAWVGFAGQPEIERSQGIRMSSAYSYSSVLMKPPYGGPAVGYLNGSGQPQKFADERGGVLDIYQLGIHVCDEMLKSRYLGFGAEAAWRETQELIDASLARWHSYVGLSFHPLTCHHNPEAKRWLREMILPYARSQGLPIRSSEQILDFADVRRGCRWENAEWASGELRGELVAPADGAGLTLMLPGRVGGRSLTRLSVAGEEVAGPEADLVGSRWRSAVVDGARAEVVARYGG